MTSLSASVSALLKELYGLPGYMEVSKGLNQDIAALKKDTHTKYNAFIGHSRSLLSICTLTTFGSLYRVRPLW